MNRIKVLRTDANMTQEELAAKLNVKRAVISKYENGKIPLTDSLLTELVSIFDVSIDYILGVSDKKKEAQDEIDFDDFTYAMHNEGKELTESQKEQLLEMARFFKHQLDEKKNKEGK